MVPKCLPIKCRNEDTLQETVLVVKVCKNLWKGGGGVAALNVARCPGFQYARPRNVWTHGAGEKGLRRKYLTPEDE